MATRAKELSDLGNLKLDVTADGIEVIGDVTADGLNVDNLKILSAQSSTPTNLASPLIYRTGSHADYANGDMIIQSRSSASRAIYMLTGTTDPVNRLRIGGSGDISFYEDTGDTAKFFWDASAESLGIGTDSPQDTLHVVTDSATTDDTVDVVRIEATSTGTPEAGFGPAIEFRAERGNASADSVGRLGFVADNMTPSRVDGAFIAETAIDGVFTERLRIESTGNVGIGTDDPQSHLEIEQTGSTVFDATDTSGQTGDGATLAIQNLSDTNDTFSQILFRNRNSSKAVSRIASITNGTGTDLAFVVENQGSAPSEVMRIEKTGMIGIGTDDPSSLLNVHSSTAPKITISNGGGTSPNPELELYRQGGVAARIVYEVANKDLVIKNDSTLGNIQFKQGSATQVEIEGSTGTVDVSNDLVANNAKLKAIDKDISDTAIDVFVYDTSKDSDGGAWRKRTQNTSWYNETLNTATRGSRREFPAVAVIVAETTQITIYDGDDPSMPMWMTFPSGTAGAGWIRYINVHYSNTVITGVIALNGIMPISIGGSGFGGIVTADFISDNGAVIYAGIDEKRFIGSIIDRDSIYNTYEISTRQIINRQVNDVAMTVLPHAPIDAATGLPIPTIAVATNGGVSVIKDDGTVVDITVNNANYTHAHKVDFLNDNSLGMSIGVTNGIAQESYYIFNSIPTTDNVITVDNIAGTTQNVDEFYAIQHPNTLVDLQINGVDTNRKLSASTGNIFGSDEGLSIIDRKVGAPDKGMVAYIGSDYNTGWMIGQTKLSTLSDTSGDQISSNNFVTNGDMSTSDTSSFVPYNSGTLGASVSITNGELKLTHTGTTNYAFARVIFDAEIGQVYTVKGRLKNGNASSYAQVKPHSGCTFNPGEKVHSGTSYEDFYFTVTATATSVQFRLQLVGSNGQYAYFDDIVAKRAVADRTLYNNNALEVYGTITKTAVATGADLVGYNTAAENTRFLLPDASDIALGTGDFTILLWVNEGTFNTNHYVMDKVITDGSGTGRLYVIIDPNGKHVIGFPGQSAVTSTGASVSEGTWQLVSFIRRSGVMYFGINENIVHSASVSYDAEGGTTGHKAYIGDYSGGQANYGFDSMALFRLSKTGISDNQLSKIYEDEKALFQENAKATLYGSSDAVTALAYDDDTEILHAGTDQGRSDFQGLRRINNTTIAVGTAISAVDGFIVEE